MVDQTTETVEKFDQTFQSGPPDSTATKYTEININIPKVGEQPSEAIWSDNKCEGCKALYPIQGLALVNCPGCNQPTLLIKLSNCPKCNEPTKSIRIRVDHVSDKMPHGSLCKGQLGVGDSFYVEIEKPAWRDDDHRIKNTKNNPKQGKEYQGSAEEENPSDESPVEGSERPSKSGDCGCKKAKNR
jgi:hypothetical protein